MEAEEKEIDFKYLEEKIKSLIEALEKCQKSDSELVRATGTLFLGWVSDLTQNGWACKGNQASPH